MQLYMDRICFEGNGKAGVHSFSMGEDDCVLKTVGSMSMTCNGGIRVSAPNITVRTPIEINQIKSREYAVTQGRRMSAKGSRNPATGGDASFAMQYEFNGLAGQGILRGTEYEEYKAFDDAPDYDVSTSAKIVSGVVVALLVGAAVGLIVAALAPASLLVAAAGVTALQVGVCAGVITAGVGIAAVASTYFQDKKNGTHSSIDTYTNNAFTASAEVGGAIIQLFLIPRGAEMLAYMATGGLSIPVMGGVITPQQIYALSRLVGRGISLANLWYKLCDVSAFIWGKMNQETGRMPDGSGIRQNFQQTC